MNDPQSRCKSGPGVLQPLVDRSLCEGKAECERVCPYGVFRVGTLPVAERAGISLRGRLKGIVHRWQQAIVVDAEACHGCGLCVSACPEAAITLVRR